MTEEVKYTKERVCECGQFIKSMPVKHGKKALTICRKCGEFVELEFKQDGEKKCDTMSE